MIVERRNLCGKVAATCNEKELKSQTAMKHRLSSNKHIIEADKKTNNDQQSNDIPDLE